MRTMSNIGPACAGLCLAAAIPMIGLGQGRDPAEGIGGPLTGAPVLNAPFSADAITTVRLTLADGTRLNQSTTARYYRDRAGRARVEFARDGLETPNSVGARHIRTIVDPATDRVVVSTLDPVSRTTRHLSRAWLAYASGGASAADALGDGFPYSSNPPSGKLDGAFADGKSGFTFAVPIRGDGRERPVQFLMLRRAQDLLTSNPGLSVINVQDDLLGNRLIADVETTGRRVAMTIPAVVLGNDKPFEMVDERWESPELKVLVSAHTSDSRMGEVDYRLVNIRRFAPPADLFVVPEDYRLDCTLIPNDNYISLMYTDRYPNVGVSYKTTCSQR